MFTDLTSLLPVRVISDVHVGHMLSRVKHSEQLRPLFYGVKCLVFNGDTFESFTEADRLESIKQKQILLDLARESKVKLIFLSGNHDPIVSEYNELEFENIKIYHGDVHTFTRGAPNKFGELLKYER